MIHCRTENAIKLELPDMIRINRLVRGTIDLAGFYVWYDALTALEQIWLLYYLHLFAQQAGYDASVYEQAVQSAQLATDHPLVSQLQTFRGGFSKDAGDLDNWLSEQAEGERRLLLPLLVFLFGYAAGRSYVGCLSCTAASRHAGENGVHCNHWWHRDLLDERVVQDLLSDPTYYLTSQKDDHKNS